MPSNRVQTTTRSTFGNVKIGPARPWTIATPAAPTAAKPLAKTLQASAMQRAMDAATSKAGASPRGVGGITPKFR